MDPARRPVLVDLYRQFVDDEDTAEFLIEVGRRYTIGSLERLAERGTRTARRAALLALGFLSDYGSNDVIGRALRDRDSAVRLIADNAIRQVWCRWGDETHRRRLATIMRNLGSGEHSVAIRLATELVHDAPTFAEAWNQRAIAQYQVGRYAESIADCRRTLRLNGYHFGAASGMALSYLQLGDDRAALDCFRRALRIHPGLDSVRARVNRLKHTLGERRGGE